jgi:hypothetical protein
MKLYLDDIRTPNDNSWTIVRSYHDFIQVVSQSFKEIKVISFDHDLGSEETGFDCAKFLVEYCMNNQVLPPQCYSHSANPSGRTNIIELINCFLRFNEVLETCSWSNISHFSNEAK